MNRIMGPTWIDAPLPPSPNATAEALPPTPPAPRVQPNRLRWGVMILCLCVAAAFAADYALEPEAGDSPRRAAVAVAQPPATITPRTSAETGLSPVMPSVPVSAAKLAAAEVAAPTSAEPERAAQAQAAPTVDAAAETRVRKRATPRGRLRIVHPGGMVLLNGEWLDARAPAALPVRSGWHTVAVRSDRGILTAPRRVRVRPGKTATLRF